MIQHPLSYSQALCAPFSPKQAEGIHVLLWARGHAQCHLPGDPLQATPWTGPLSWLPHSTGTAVSFHCKSLLAGEKTLLAWRDEFHTFSAVKHNPACRKALFHLWIRPSGPPDGQSAHSSCLSKAPWEFRDLCIPVCLQLDPLHPKSRPTAHFPSHPTSFQTSVIKYLPTSPCPELPRLKLTDCSSLHNLRYKGGKNAIFSSLLCTLFEQRSKSHHSTCTWTCSKRQPIFLALQENHLYWGFYQNPPQTVLTRTR